MAFLSRLADRAVGRAKTLAPLRLPAFAPAPQWPHTAEVPAESPLSSNLIPTLDEPMPQTGPAARAGHVSGGDAAGSTAGSSTTRGDGVARQVRRRRGPALRSHPAGHDGRTESSVSVATEARQPTQVARPTEAEQGDHLTVLIAANRPPGPGAVGSPADNTRAGEERLPVRESTGLRPRPATAESAMVPGRPVTVQSPTTFLRGPAGQPRGQNAPKVLSPPGRREPAPPQIKVTIGRVEVRAAVPPTLPVPVRRPGPKLTLERYLEQRAKGER
jgi:hypothetical protein